MAFNNQEFRITHLHWRQSLFQERLIAHAGLLDIIDCVDVNAAVSPWTTFANSDPTDVFNGFEAFQSLELGLLREPDQISRDHVHVTFWQIDDRAQAGTPNGLRVSLFATHVMGESWLPFLRGRGD